MTEKYSCERRFERISGAKRKGIGVTLFVAFSQSPWCCLLASKFQWLDCNNCLACSLAQPAARTNWLTITCSRSESISVFFNVKLPLIHAREVGYTRQSTNNNEWPNTNNKENCTELRAVLLQGCQTAGCLAKPRRLGSHPTFRHAVRRGE